jgi:hypothetical protein
MGWLFEAPPFNPKTKLINMKDLDQDEGQMQMMQMGGPGMRWRKREARS